MKAYFTFRSLLTNPQGTDVEGKKILEPHGYLQAMLLYDALSGEFRLSRKPRTYYPIGCWGFPMRAEKAHVLLLLQSGQETAGNEGGIYQITLIAWRWLLVDFIWSRKLVTATNIIGSALERWVAADERLSELKRFGRAPAILRTRQTAETAHVRC
jgi:hypothetical protein